jgi:hypothetical protein
MKKASSKIILGFAMTFSLCAHAQNGNRPIADDPNLVSPPRKMGDYGFGAGGVRDSVMQGGAAGGLPGSSVGVPNPCDFDPQRCVVTPPSTGGGGSGTGGNGGSVQTFSTVASGRFSAGGLGGPFEIQYLDLPDAPQRSDTYVIVEVTSAAFISGCSSLDTSSALATWMPLDYMNWDGPGSWKAMLTAPNGSCRAGTAFSYRIDYKVTTK